MAAVGKIVAVLTARTGGFVKGINRAANRSRRFGKAISGVAKRVAKLGIGLAAVAAGALVLVVKSQLKAIDSLAKLSRNLGVSVEQLQAFKLAAAIAGVSGEVFDKALKRLVKSTGDLEAGLSTQVRAFERLGLSIEDVRGLRPDEVMKKIADAVRDVGVTVNTTAAIMDIFGARIGADLVEFLRRGSEGLTQFEADAKALGLTISGIDAAQVEAANDAMTRLRAVISGVAQKITVELAPFITAAVNELIEMGNVGEAIGPAIEGALETASKVLSVGARFVQAWVVAWKAAELAIKRVQLALVNAFVQVEIFRGADLTVGPARAAIETMLKLEGRVKTLKRELNDGWDDLGVDSWAEGIEDLFERIRDGADEARREAERLRRETDFPGGLGEPPPAPTAPPPATATAAAEIAKAIADEPVREPRTGDFAQVRLSRVALNGAGGDRGDDKTNELLTESNRRLQEMLNELRNPNPVLIRWS